MACVIVVCGTDVVIHMAKDVWNMTFTPVTSAKSEAADRLRATRMYSAERTPWTGYGPGQPEPPARGPLR